jgi:hypothetical protein
MDAMLGLPTAYESILKGDWHRPFFGGQRRNAASSQTSRKAGSHGTVSVKWAFFDHRHSSGFATNRWPTGFGQRLKINGDRTTLDVLHRARDRQQVASIMALAAFKVAWVSRAILPFAIKLMSLAFRVVVE